MNVIYHSRGNTIYRVEVERRKYYAINKMGPLTYQLELGDYSGSGLDNNVTFKEWDAALAAALTFINQFPTRE